MIAWTSKGEFSTIDSDISLPDAMQCFSEHGYTIWSLAFFVAVAVYSSEEFEHINPDKNLLTNFQFGHILWQFIKMAKRTACLHEVPGLVGVDDDLVDIMCAKMEASYCCEHKSKELTRNWFATEEQQQCGGNGLSLDTDICEVDDEDDELYPDVNMESSEEEVGGHDDEDDGEDDA